MYQQQPPKRQGGFGIATIFADPKGSIAALVGPDRRRLILSHGDLTGRGDVTSAVVTPGNAHLAANANPHNWMKIGVPRGGRKGNLFVMLMAQCISELDPNCHKPARLYRPTPRAAVPPG